MKMMQYRFILLLGIFCMIMLVCCGIDKKERTCFEEKVVRIECEGQSGSGVVYEQTDDQLIIVTASHVVEGADNARIGQGSTAEVISVAGLDLAFLRVSDVKADWTVRSDLQKREMKEEDILELSLQGYDKSDTLIEHMGTLKKDWIYVEDFKSHMMIVNATAVPGMSGGGVFDKSGTFVGIICGIDESENVAVLPAGVIESEYSALFQN